MTRLTTITIIACAILAATAGAAQARSATEGCGLKSPGAPVIHSSSSITSTGVARCNTQWRATADLQVEQNGTWATAFSDGEPVAPQVDGPYTARVDHRTDYQWGLLDVSPYCSYNWRLVVTYTDQAGDQIGVAFSPETFSTCPKSLRA